MKTLFARSVIAMALLAGTLTLLSKAAAQTDAPPDHEPSESTVCCTADDRYWYSSVRRCSLQGGLITSAGECRNAARQDVSLQDEARCCRGGAREQYVSAEACRRDGGRIVRGRRCRKNDTAIRVAYTGHDPAPIEEGGACCWRERQIWYALSPVSCRRARARIIGLRHCRNAMVGQGPDGKITISRGSFDILNDAYGGICCKTRRGLRYAVSRRACRRAGGNVYWERDCQDAALRFEVEIPPLTGPVPLVDAEPGGVPEEAPYDEEGEGSAEASYEDEEEADLYEESGEEPDEYPEESGYEEPDEYLEEEGS